MEVLENQRIRTLLAKAEVLFGKGTEVGCLEGSRFQIPEYFTRHKAKIASHVLNKKVH